VRNNQQKIDKIIIDAHKSVCSFAEKFRRVGINLKDLKEKIDKKEPKKKEKPHPNPYTRKYKKERR
jgi:hypothetical protein